MAQTVTATHIGEATGTIRKKGRISQRIFRSRPCDELPLFIKHERIYILPSSRGLAFICVIAIMLMASINYSLNLGYALCFILIGLFAACLLATYKNLVKVKFLSINATDTFAGSELRYVVRFSEEAKRHRSSISLTTQHATTIVDAAAQTITEEPLVVTNATRGMHTLGRLTISSDFPLGLWRGWCYLHTPVHAYVYPQPENPAVEFQGFSPTTGGPQATQVSELEYSGLKTYENSDSPSRVAWKRVASGAGWYSKQFEAETEQREVAIRWQDTPAHLGTEQRLSRMCSWVMRARDENIAHTFELPGCKPLALASGQEHYENCLRALAVYGSEKTDQSQGHEQNTGD